MVIFHSYVKLPEGTSIRKRHAVNLNINEYKMWDDVGHMYFLVLNMHQIHSVQWWEVVSGFGLRGIGCSFPNV